MLVACAVNLWEASGHSECLSASCSCPSFFWLLWDRSCCSLGWSESCYVDRTGLELIEIPPIPVSWVLGKKACATMPSFRFQSVTSDKLRGESDRLSAHYLKCLSIEESWSLGFYHVPVDFPSVSLLNNVTTEGRKEGGLTAAETPGPLPLCRVICWWLTGLYWLWSGALWCTHQWFMICWERTVDSDGDSAVLFSVVSSCTLCSVLCEGQGGSHSNLSWVDQIIVVRVTIKQAIEGLCISVRHSLLERPRVSLPSLNLGLAQVRWPHLPWDEL